MTPVNARCTNLGTRRRVMVHTKGFEIFFYENSVLVNSIVREEFMHKALPEINVVVLQ